MLSLQAVFADGSCLESDLSHGLPAEGEFYHHALAVTEAVCRDKRAQILNKFPPLNRFLTGYDLKNAINEEMIALILLVSCVAQRLLSIHYGSKAEPHADSKSAHWLT